MPSFRIGRNNFQFQHNFNDQEGVYYILLVSYKITAKTSTDRAAYEIPLGALKNCGVRVHLVGFGVNRALK